MGLFATGCSLLNNNKPANMASIVSPGAFAATDRELLVAAAPWHKFTVITLTAPGQNAEATKMIRDEGGSIRVADEKTGIVVGEVTARAAIKLEDVNRSRGSSAAVTFIALDQVHDYSLDFKRESVNPETGLPNVVNEIKIDRSAKNAQLPTHEMGVLDFESQIQQRFGFTPDGSSVNIAILDTGLDLAHTDVFQNRVVQSWDATKEGRILTVPAIYSAATHTVTPMVAGNDPKAPAIKLVIPDSLVSATGHYFIGAIAEASYSGKESFSDLDQDGTRDGVFPFLLTETADGYRVVVDTNRNGNLSDEAPIRDYRRSGDTVIMDRSRVGLVRMNFNLPLAEDGSLVGDKNEAGADTGTVTVNVAGFDPGQHGTHVAGIAAGRFEGPQFGGAFRGGAPAAKLFGIRVIGKSGGADADIVTGIILAVTNKADVINLSLGSSPRPSDGLDTLAQVVDQVARRADVIFMISAGNSGAGMNSVGSPSSAARAISVGAYVSGATWRTDYNFSKAPLGNFIWTFSSVGPLDNGEVRPTILAPGAAYSSTPLWRSPHVNSGYDVFQGTSMAAPAATGSAALFIDTLRKLKGKLDLQSDSLSVAMALIDGAVDLNELNKDNPLSPVYQRFEQGSGLINLPKAFGVLEKRSNERAVEYVVTTTSLRESYTKPAHGAYSTSRLPPVVTFTVRRHEDAVPNINEHNFYREVVLSSDAPWAQPANEALSINGLNESTVNVKIDQDTVSAFTPGVHSARIYGRSPVNKQLEFVFDITYVKAREVSQLQNRSESVINNINLKVGSVRREFFFVGVDRSRFSVSLSVPEFMPDGTVTDGRYRLTILDPLGREVFQSPYVFGLNPRIEQAQTTPMPGVWEVVLERSFTSEKEAPAVLRFSTDSLLATPQDWSAGISPGQNTVTHSFSVANYGRPVTPVATIMANHISTVSTDVALVNKQKKTITIKVPEGIHAIVIGTEEVKDSPNSDIDLKLLDSEGKVLGESGGQFAKESIEAAVKPGSTITLEIDAFDLAGAPQGRVDVTWSFVLPFDLRGEIIGLNAPLAWGKSTSFTANIDISPLPSQMIADLKKDFGTATLSGEISIFDGRALPEKQIAAIPIELALP
jgi:hypothetical protein